MVGASARLRYPFLVGLALVAGLTLRYPSAIAANWARLAIINCLWPPPTVALACQVSGQTVLARALRQTATSSDSAERARFWGYTSDWARLRSDYEQASTPIKDPLHLHWVGLAYYNLGDTEAAVEVWKRAPETANYWMHVCVAGINSQRWSEARQACELALRIAPEHGQARAELGRVELYGEGDARGALVAFAAAEVLGGHNAITWLAWAHALDQTGRSAEAAELLETHALSGPLADAIRGNALRQAGRLEEAILMYQQALAQNDCDPWFWHALAATYVQLGNEAAARAAWAEALALAPDFQPALDGLAALGPN
ncbi:MAG: tetratricopeptide repeat protein [Anaerolineales bacterium]|nr:tetratricopeptide repeat protein [Anaerolineales bacterium]